MRQDARITNTADEALTNCVLRALAQRAGGSLTVAMSDVHAAAAAGELRWYMDDDGNLIMRLIEPGSARAAA